jgi:hypothetical protein
VNQGEIRHVLQPPTQFQDVSQPVALDWWSTPGPLASDIASQDRFLMRRACYRVGAGVLDIQSDCEEVFDLLRQSYAECEISDSGPSGEIRVTCSVRSGETTPVSLAAIHGSVAFDSTSLVLGLLENADWRYRLSRARSDGWELMTRAEAPSRPLMAMGGANLLVDRFEVPAQFLVSYVVSAIQRAQEDLVFVHAGSVGIRGAGILLIGAGGAGKTTISLGLASRGHAFFGDDVAAIRRQPCEIIPFRQTVNIRPGPRAQAVDTVLNQGSHPPVFLSDGTSRVQVRIGELFPGPAVKSLPLISAFFLRRFANRAAAEPIALSIGDMELLKPLSFESTVLACWGRSPGSRLMRFLALLHMLSQVRCYLLNVGRPEETSELIEMTMEDIWS